MVESVFEVSVVDFLSKRLADGGQPGDMQHTQFVDDAGGQVLWEALEVAQIGVVVLRESTWWM
jgi:hypothetical protein